MTQEVAHQERAHSTTVGGSSAARIMSCPGSYKLSKTLPSPGSSSFAEEGTALHEAMDVILTETVENDRDVIGMEFNGYVITEELYAEGIEPALEYLDELYDELSVIECRVEQRVQFVGIEGAFGTVDVLLKCPDRTVVLDWKFGSGVPVSAVDNKQLQFYAYAASVDERTEHMFDPSKIVELIIAQPRQRDEDARYTRWRTNMPELKVFAKNLSESMEIAQNDPNAPFKLGKHCKFCPAEPACPLKHDLIERTRDVDPEFVEHMSEWLAICDELEPWIKTIRKRAHDALEDGLKIRGYKLVASRPSQAYTDEEKMSKKARNLFKLDEWSPRKMLTPAQMRKLYKQAGKKFPEDMIAWLSKGNTMASADDPKPEVVLRSETLKKLGEHLASK